ncbi:Uncharacterized protein APZ42_033327 [Daphnia magna]|uniref:Uncharacterized protein n=1 Tax=Daphnia magna TaxID=35525 RepID=A0A164L729_9CRUS|nr:Uncharacterized protein APZ42_033327 [Daphnia magna]
MISSTLDPIDGHKIGEHPTVVQLLKGCFNRPPLKARYNSLWDPDVVLKYLDYLPDNADFRDRFHLLSFFKIFPDSGQFLSNPA